MVKFGKIRCKSCLEDKPSEDFYPNKTYASGVTSKCKVCLRKATKHYVSLKPEKYKQDRKERYWKNREDNIKKVVEWGRQNKDKRKIAKDKWRAKNKTLTNHLTKGYHYRRKGAKGKHTLKEWIELCRNVNGKCVACHVEAKLTKDHIIPLSKGGTDYIDNIQPLCVSCNSKKGNKYIINYINHNELKKQII